MNQIGHDVGCRAYCLPA